ncbi:MAG: two-component system response regulator GlrR [Nitrospirae bacterium RBG_13_43_8]|nr:MAG: two-component system response regulator GlrR [Nitrospirae bacterium RBG_13_43_8]
MSAPKILVVDDDKNLLELLKMRLESEHYEAVAVWREEDAVKEMKNQIFDLSIIDLQLNTMDGVSLMEKLHLVNPEMPVIILTAYGSIESAVEAMKKGACNYLTKPFDPRELLFQIESAIEKQKLSCEIKRLKGLLEERHDFRNIVSRNEKMQDILGQVAHIAGTDSTIFIYGESGTGKELVAKAIHLASNRRDKPFVGINCAAIPETLLESELFGHEKGAFTGAVRDSKGLFTQAHEGTIFLDEIGDMPLSIQAKLLRVLQEKQFYPVGSGKPVEVDARIIVATNKDLEAEMKAGRFREDLYYRIHVIPIHLPPLRDRKEDIPLLVEHFLKTFSHEIKKEVKGITSAAMQKLMLYDWPGNVRELKNAIEYAVAMTRQEVISEDLILHSENIPQEPLMSLKEARDTFEKGYIIRLLELSKGNVSKAAASAGKYRADFYNLLKKYNIKPENFK